MSTYLERYKNGEYEQVWAELLALGGQIREEPLYSDALAVAHETIRRAKANLETLILRLIDLGYQFAEPKYFFSPSTKKDLITLKNIEQEIGLIPLSIRVWYEEIGEVNFSGSHPKLSRELVEPFLIFPFSANEHLVGLDSEDFDIDSTYLDLVSYENYSWETQIQIPNPAIDGLLLGNWQEYEGITFIGYLREVFQTGGFPGLQFSSNPPKETLAFLTEGLLPI